MCRIFLFPTPSLVPQNYAPGSKLSLPDSMGSKHAIQKDRHFAPGTTTRQRFIQQMREVITCRFMTKIFHTADEVPARAFYFTRALHGFLNWQSFSLQIVFPIVTALGILLVWYDEGYCTLHLGDCDTSAEWENPGI